MCWSQREFYTNGCVWWRAGASHVHGPESAHVRTCQLHREGSTQSRLFILMQDIDLLLYTWKWTRKFLQLHHSGCIPPPVWTEGGHLSLTMATWAGCVNHRMHQTSHCTATADSLLLPKWPATPKIGLPHDVRRMANAAVHDMLRHVEKHKME